MIHGQIDDVNEAPGRQHTAGGGVLVRFIRRLFTPFDEQLRHIMRCDEMQSIAIPATDDTVVSIAEPNGTCQYVGKNYLGIGG